MAHFKAASELVTELNFAIKSSLSNKGKNELKSSGQVSFTVKPQNKTPVDLSFHYTEWKVTQILCTTSDQSFQTDLSQPSIRKKLVDFINMELKKANKVGVKLGFKVRRTNPVTFYISDPSKGYLTPEGESTSKISEPKAGKKGEMPKADQEEVESKVFVEERRSFGYLNRKLESWANVESGSFGYLTLMKTQYFFSEEVILELVNTPCSSTSEVFKDVKRALERTKKPVDKNLTKDIDDLIRGSELREDILKLWSDKDDQNKFYFCCKELVTTEPKIHLGTEELELINEAQEYFKELLSSYKRSDDALEADKALEKLKFFSGVLSATSFSQLSDQDFSAQVSKVTAKGSRLREITEKLWSEECEQEKYYFSVWKLLNIETESETTKLELKNGIQALFEELWCGYVSDFDVSRFEQVKRQLQFITGLVCKGTIGKENEQHKELIEIINLFGSLPRNDWTDENVSNAKQLLEIANRLIDSPSVRVSKCCRKLAEQTQELLDNNNAVELELQKQMSLSSINSCESGSLAGSSLYNPIVLVSQTPLDEELLIVELNAFTERKIAEWGALFPQFIGNNSKKGKDLLIYVLENIEIMVELYYENKPENKDDEWICASISEKDVEHIKTILAGICSTLSLAFWHAKCSEMLEQMEF